MTEALNMHCTNIYMCDQLRMIFVTHPLIQQPPLLPLRPIPPPLFHNHVTRVTHSLFQCSNPYYIWHQFRIIFGTLFTFSTGYYEFLILKTAK